MITIPKREVANRAIKMSPVRLKIITKITVGVITINLLASS
jgi:hypothetical protein